MLFISQAGEFKHCYL